MSRTDLARKRGEIRVLIRAAAIAEFAELGLRGASTQGIADRAGISKNKLHYYIDSKEELYQDALDHILEIWADLFDGIDLARGPESVLSDYIDRKVGFSLSHPAEVKLFTGEVMRGAPLLRDRWAGSREATRRAARQIEGWVADGLIRPVDPMMLQFNIWAMTESYAVMGTQMGYMQGLEPGAPLDRAAITAEITALVLNGLRP